MSLCGRRFVSGRRSSPASPSYPCPLLHRNMSWTVSLCTVAACAVLFWSGGGRELPQNSCCHTDVRGGAILSVDAVRLQEVQRGGVLSELSDACAEEAASEDADKLVDGKDIFERLDEDIVVEDLELDDEDEQVEEFVISPFMDDIIEREEAEDDVVFATHGASFDFTESSQDEPGEEEEQVVLLEPGQLSRGISELLSRSGMSGGDFNTIPSLGNTDAIHQLSSMIWSASPSFFHDFFSQVGASPAVLHELQKQFPVVEEVPIFGQQKSTLFEHPVTVDELLEPDIPTELPSVCELYEEATSVFEMVSNVLESSEGFVRSSPGLSAVGAARPGSYSSAHPRNRYSPASSASAVGWSMTGTAAAFTRPAQATSQQTATILSMFSSARSTTPVGRSSTSPLPSGADARQSVNECSTTVPPALLQLHRKLASAIWATPPLTAPSPVAQTETSTQTERELSNLAGPPPAAMRHKVESYVTVPETNAVVEGMKTLVYLALWYAGNVMYNIENKKALNIFPLPSTVATIQMIMGIPIFILPWLLGMRPVPSLHKGWTWEGMKPFMGQAVWHSMNHLSAVVALGAGAISFVHIVKAAEPAFTAALSTMMGAKPLSVPTYLALVPVILGVSLASLKELSFTWKALIGATLSNFGSSMRGIAAKETLSNTAAIGTDLSAPNVYALLTACASVMLAPVALAEYQSWGPAYQKALASGSKPMDIAKHVLGSAWWYYLYNEVAFVALQRLNPVSHAVANTVKRVFLILTSVMVFGTKFTAMGLGGSAMAVGGTLLYSLFKQRFG
eukprot:GHVQ01012573.1.p1 GENE.GHVQ01012573.1~~GHVQ01012573.1.p1  ORF type:complete len:793 (+),score=142.42 GHVQ01012573.1:59-2437(+)